MEYRNKEKKRRKNLKVAKQKEAEVIHHKNMQTLGIL